MPRGHLNDLARQHNGDCSLSHDRPSSSKENVCCQLSKLFATRARNFHKDPQGRGHLNKQKYFLSHHPFCAVLCRSNL